MVAGQLTVERHREPPHQLGVRARRKAGRKFGQRLAIVLLRELFAAAKRAKSAR
jgi:hypothetical protein